MKVLKKIVQGVITIVGITWLAVWMTFIIIGACMTDLFLRFLRIDEELMILKNFGDTLGRISASMKNRENNKNEQENKTNE